MKQRNKRKILIIIKKATVSSVLCNLQLIIIILILITIYNITNYYINYANTTVNTGMGGSPFGSTGFPSGGGVEGDRSRGCPRIFFFFSFYFISFISFILDFFWILILDILLIFLLLDFIWNFFFKQQTPINISMIKHTTYSEGAQIEIGNHRVMSSTLILKLHKGESANVPERQKS